MASLKSETGSEGGGFWWAFLGIFMSFGFGLQTMEWLGLQIPSSDYMVVRILVLLLFTAVSYAVF